jgi:hypothetical protein
VGNRFFSPIGRLSFMMISPWLACSTGRIGRRSCAKKKNRRASSLGKATGDFRSPHETSPTQGGGKPRLAARRGLPSNAAGGAGIPSPNSTIPTHARLHATIKDPKSLRPPDTRIRRTEMRGTDSSVVVLHVLGSRPRPPNTASTCT